MKTSTGCLLAAALLASAGTASGLNINLTFDAGASDNPASDPAAAELISMMQWAANYWEDIIEDSGTLNIRYFWTDLDDNVLGDHLNTGTSGGKPTDARIRLDTTLSNGNARLWYYDQTPGNNSEFDIEQTLYRDLTGTQQANWFNGAPQLFEVGYRGDARSTAPAAARNGFDLLSTVIHELGHAVGLTGNVSSGEYADGDYDVPTSLTNGITTGIEGDFHVEAQTALMCGGCGASGVRRLPTATDVLAAATGSGWNDIDLPRQDMLSAGDMRNAFEWVGGQVPGGADEAYIRHGGTAQITTPGTFFATSLFVGDGSDVQTNDDKIDIANTVTIQRAAGDGSTQIFVEVGGELEATDVIVNGGELDMTGGLADIADDLDTEVFDGLIGEVNGNGTVDVAGTFRNDGRIRPDGGRLTFVSANGTNAWDLDGTGGDGLVDASVGDITFASGGVADPFDGVMTVGDGQDITFNVDWELGVGGVLNLNGGATISEDAEILGTGTTILAGVVNVDGFTAIDTPVIVESTATVNIPDSDDQLTLGNSTGDSITYNGGTFTGTGTLVQNGDATVSSGSTVTIQTWTFDWDGGTISDTTLESNSQMDITGRGINDAHDGVITIGSGAVLNVNTRAPLIINPLAEGDSPDVGGSGIIINPILFPVAWTLSGTMNMNGGDLEGSRMIVGDGGTGTVNALSGTNEIFAPVTFTSTSVTNTTSVLELEGTAIFEGGTHTGTGTLRFNSNVTIAADTVISTDTLDWDGSSGGDSVTTVNDGVVFTINSDVIDIVSDPYGGTLNINGGRASVNTAATWDLDGTINMVHAGSGTPFLTGTEVRIVPGGVINVSGSGGQSQIGADVHLDDGSIVVEADASVRAQGFMELAGGTITGAGTFLQSDASVTAPTTVDVTRYDLDGTAGPGASLNLISQLTIDSDYIESSGTSNAYDGMLGFGLFGRLTVNTLGSWVADGPVTFNSISTGWDVIVGQAVRFSNTISVDGFPQVRARATFDSDVVMTFVDASAQFRLEHNGSLNRIEGGIIRAGGTLAANNFADLHGFGSIASTVNFLVGSDLMADDGTLNVDGAAVTSVGTIGTADTDGVLRFTTPFNTGVASVLELNGGSVTGSEITNDGITRGRGSITTEGFNNTGVLEGVGGLLIVATTPRADIDGTPETGIVRATQGSIQYVNTNTLFGFDTQMEIGGPWYFQITDGRLLMRPGSDLFMTGGRLIAPILELDGNLDVNSATTSILQSPDTTFFSGSVNNVDTDLQILGGATVRSGAGFAGTGRMLVSSSSSLALLNGADVGIEVVNQGLLTVGSSPGIAGVNEFTQTVTGTLEMEIDSPAGAGVGHDLLEVTFDGFLGGELSLLMGYEPDYGDAFKLITTDGGDLFDTFDVITGLVVTPDKYMAVIYDNMQLVLAIAALPGDANLDGTVDLIDLSLLASGFGDLGTWATGDFDGSGKVDLVDLSLLASNFGAVVPLPEPGMGALLGLGLAGLRRRRAA
ncbi:hypothetical protein [Mucisphaera sp.]|uniref:hypothetical protein n=1 Tax=Mucisphaera sp. TaxID=2913024 RepID=UPI003D0DC2A2